MKLSRRLLISVVALGLAPTWLRSPPPVPDYRPVLELTPLVLRARRAGPLELLGAWRLESPNEHFGGYSALLSLGDGRLLAASDRGRMLLFSPPGEPPSRVRFDSFAGGATGDKRLVDVEALTRDPDTGTVWAAYEGRNQIERLSPDLATRRTVRPTAMRRWPANGGPEALVRLRDGRFIVLAEKGRGWFAATSPGLLFPGDPLAGGHPVRFAFAPPRGYAPTDMAQLPDGRVLILLRSVTWSLPPQFPALIAVADAARIEAGGAWRSQVVDRIEPPLPSDNFEGLAIEPQADGSVVLWLISDDNGARFQDTLLLKLRWPDEEKARGSPARLLDSP